MKNKIVKIGLLCALVVLGYTTYASHKKINEKTLTLNRLKADTLEIDTFKVYGNCGMCKATIEGALKDVKGIKKAEWSTETKMMYVAYNKELITLDDIKKKITAVGYDTDKFRALDEVYGDLPGCCQYKRPNNEVDDEQ